MSELDKIQYLELLYKDLYDNIKDNFEYVEFSKIIFTQERRDMSLRTFGDFSSNPYLKDMKCLYDSGWNNLKEDLKIRVLVPFGIKNDKNGIWLVEGFHRFQIIEQMVKEGLLDKNIKLPCINKNPTMEYDDLVRIINRISSSTEEKYYPPEWMRYD